MKIDLEGRINNISLSKSNALWPLYEAITNSLQAVEEAEKWDSGYIKIRIIRDTSAQALGLDSDPSIYPIKSFEVEDNGIGFTEENFLSFNTSDSTKKKATGGKGIGRFLWLKAFHNIQISSIFKDVEKTYERKFEFSIKHGGPSTDEKTESDKLETKTIVKLEKFKEPYQSDCPKKSETIGTKIISHFLSYFVLDNCPSITLLDDESKIDLKGLFERITHKYLEKKSFDINNHHFEIKHIKLYSSEDRHHKIYYCGDNREVKNEKLQKSIPDLKTKIQDEEKNEFFYVGYVSGKYLNDRINSERTDFDLYKGDDSSLLNDLEVSENQLRSKAIETIKEYLDKYLAPIRKEKNDRIEEFVKTQNPRYRPLLAHKKKYLDKITPGLSDQQLEIELHKIYRDAESELMKESNDFLGTNIKDVKDIKEYMEKYNYFIEQINDFGKAELAQYITHRKIMLELLDKSIQNSNNGKYQLEKTVHNIIFPLKSTSDDINYENQNLWIIDEKLSYHSYLASDVSFKKMKELSTANEDRPDLIIFNGPIAFTEGESPYSSIVIIEFKRPGKKDYNEDGNPITQVYSYVREIKNEKANNKDGRPIRNTSNIPFYCYIICDLTPKIMDLAENFNLTKTPDSEGYFGHNPNLNSYIEIISYEKLLRDAKKRNKVLFDKLFRTNSNIKS